MLKYVCTGIIIISFIATSGCARIGKGHKGHHGGAKVIIPSQLLAN